MGLSSRSSNVKVVVDVVLVDMVGVFGALQFWPEGNMGLSSVTAVVDMVVVFGAGVMVGMALPPPQAQHAVVASAPRFA